MKHRNNAICYDDRPNAITRPQRRDGQPRAATSTLPRIEDHDLGEIRYVLHTAGDLVGTVHACEKLEDLQRHRLGHGGMVCHLPSQICFGTSKRLDYSDKRDEHAERENANFCVLTVEPILATFLFGPFIGCRMRVLPQLFQTQFLRNLRWRRRGGGSSGRAPAVLNTPT